MEPIVTSGNIIITSDSYVTYDYCSEINNYGTCIEWIKVVPASSLFVQNHNNSESLSMTASYVIVVLLLIWIVKGILRFIFPNRIK